MITRVSLSIPTSAVIWRSVAMPRCDVPSSRTADGSPIERAGQEDELLLAPDSDVPVSPIRLLQAIGMRQISSVG